MRVVAFVLICLPCLGRARRVQTPNFQEQEDVKALATILLAPNPESAFANVGATASTAVRRPSTAVHRQTGIAKRGAGVVMDYQEAAMAVAAEYDADWLAEPRHVNMVAGFVLEQDGPIDDDVEFSSLGSPDQVKDLILIFSETFFPPGVGDEDPGGIPEGDASGLTSSAAVKSYLSSKGIERAPARGR
mmetsp:Transcript_91873/g.159381  ORF Transcript_91873/g.159381 Transcript_91873/m.159381 type:complete len:189 (-) Transcript_91873:43-609(-)